MQVGADSALLNGLTSVQQFHILGLALLDLHYWLHSLRPKASYQKLLF